MPPRRSTRQSVASTVTTNLPSPSSDSPTPMASRAKRKREVALKEESAEEETSKSRGTEPRRQTTRTRASVTNTSTRDATRLTRQSEQSMLPAEEEGETEHEQSDEEKDKEDGPPVKKSKLHFLAKTSQREPSAGEGDLEESDSVDVVDDMSKTIIPPTSRSSSEAGSVVENHLGSPDIEKKNDPSQPSEENIPRSTAPSRHIHSEEDAKPSKARLVIHKLMLVNFKSYAGRQEIGPFHKSFSAIVGPNGSGKSNTIDALLFVFGNRASKLRQGKLSELIHNSANHPDLTECSVEVHFREIIDLPGPDAYTVIPDSHLIVSRIAYSNSTSKYKINGRTTNREEVTTLLKGKGIDLDHNRFLILQGEVESIAQMKPKAASEHEDGLLEYLEDIIGTSQYKTHIEEALVEVDRYAEQRAEKLNRLRIVEREKNALEDKKKEAEEFLKLQNEFVRAQSRLYQWYLWQCMVNEEKFAGTIMKTQKLLDEETERNRDNVAHCEALQKHYDDRVTAYEEVKRHAGEVMQTLQAREKEEVGLQERKKHANGKAKKLKKSLQDDAYAKAEAERFAQSNADKIERERAKLEKLEVSLDQEESALDNIRDSLKDKTRVFHDQIEIKQKELVPWEAKINKTKAEVDIASSERDMLAQKAEAAEKTAADAQETLHQLTGDRDAKVAELERLQAEKNTSLKEIKASEKRLQDLQARVHDLRGNASSSRQKADEARASQVANTSQNNVLNSLTRLKNSGRISGFHGRLGSLGTIPEKFDVAISTACPSLNSLIVDQVDQGQACIEYLRKQNIGRANFMVLEKLSTNGMDAITTPENVPRLFDLIKPKEPRFAPAFFKGVGNTLVADDLEQANRIAFGGQRRWRVVTLAGQLIDTSGTMSGGGTKVAKGGMSSKLAADSVSPEVIKRYEKDSEHATQQLEEASEELRKAELDADTSSKKVPKIEMDIHKVELDIQTSSKRIDEATKRVQELKSQTKPDVGDLSRISTLDKDITTSTAELERLRESAKVIEDAIQALENKILEVGGAKLLAQKSKVDGVKLHINLANEEITKAEVAKAKAGKDTEKLKNTIGSNTSTLEDLEQDITNLDQQLQECGEVLDDIRSKVDAAQAAAENAKEDLEGIKTDLDEKMVGIQEFRKKEMEYNQILEDAKKENVENERAIHHWQGRHDELKLEEIDDDDDDDNAAPPTTEPAEIAVKQENPDAPPQKPYDLHVYNVEELEKFTKKGLLGDATLLEDQIKQAQPNLGALKEYRKREAEFLERAQDLETVTAHRDKHKKKYDDLRKARLDEFMSGFNVISSKLKEMYQMITLGGNAELELVDSMDPFSEGIIFSVMPPKKSWKNISNLSGGEKTLSSLALVFALHVFKPTPLYFMDEIDAALDFRNVSIVANYIKDRTKNAQFIIISLRNDMFELSHRLIGIYKTSNQTRSISIDNHLLVPAPIPTVRA
ncbi:RecF/RecN/SMC protein [Ramaria rubella]|nr:RecF/RecN/SMC protein [Ramaria rubella]